VTPDEIRRHLVSRYDFSKPLDWTRSAPTSKPCCERGSAGHPPALLRPVQPERDVASIVADTLVAMYNPQLATWRTSPAANEIERHTLAWLMGKFGFPATGLASSRAAARRRISRPSSSR